MLWRGPQHCNMPKVANAYLDSSLSVSYCLFTFHDKTVPYIFLTTAPGRAFWSLDWRLSFRSPWAQPRDEEQDLISSPDPLLADTRRPQRWWHCEFPHEPAMAQTLSGRESVAFVENWWKTRKSFQSTVSASTYEYLPPPALASTVKTAKSLLHKYLAVESGWIVGKLPQGMHGATWSYPVHPDLLSPPASRAASARRARIWGNDSASCAGVASSRLNNEVSWDCGVKV